MKKIPVGILGATGMVGQNYIQLLKNHPWFEITYVAASSHSAGMRYADAVKERWQINEEIPKTVADLPVEDVVNSKKAIDRCLLVFSAFDLPDKQKVRNIENAYAAADIPVFSNASAHRDTEDVPMLIPEINPHHLDIIPVQQKKRGWKNGFIVVKPNCSLQSYLTPVFALIQAGFEVRKLIITTLQAVSGAGYPGVASLDIVDNIVPFISGEEEKTEQEPLKILGNIKNKKFIPFRQIDISAHCNRVPVIDGHTACVSALFGDKKPSHKDILLIWNRFRAEPQELKLPSAPAVPVYYFSEENRPQPRKDRGTGKGMAVSIGRLRKCPVFDYKFIGLSHNTIRGAAGGGILNAELAVKKGLLKNCSFLSISS